MNGLRLVGEFLSDHSDSMVEELESYRRGYLEAWLCEPRLNGGTITRCEAYHIKDVSLALDILISVGIGHSAEQEATVECECRRIV